MLKVDNNFHIAYETDGFAVTNDKYILNLFNKHDFGTVVNIEQIKGAETDFVIPYNPHQQKFLNQVTKYLAKTYLTKISHERITIDIWSGVDVVTREWHSDNNDGQDFSILYYLDTSLTDGAFYFKSMTQYRQIYPSAGTLMLIRQTSEHLHKADPSKNLRRIIHAEYKIAK